MQLLFRHLLEQIRYLTPEIVESCRLWCVVVDNLVLDLSPCQSGQPGVTGQHLLHLGDGAGDVVPGFARQLIDVLCGERRVQVVGDVGLELRGCRRSNLRQNDQYGGHCEESGAN